MNKLLNIVLSCILVVSCVSFCFVSTTVYADDTTYNHTTEWDNEPMTNWQIFMYEFKQKLDELSVTADNTDLGALDVLSIQYLLYDQLNAYYEKQIPLNTSLSCMVGLYDVSGASDNPHFCTIICPSYNGSVIAYSQDFQISIGWDSDYVPSASERVYSQNAVGWNLNNSQYFQLRDAKGFFTNANTSRSGAFFYSLTNYGSPTLYSGASLSSMSTLAYVRNGPASLPTGTIDTDFPWEYYNTALIPAVSLDYPDNIDSLAFPDGWEPTENPDPTEPYTGEIDNVNLPPNFPAADFHDIEVPSETLPTGLTDGAGFWFSAFSSLVSGLHLQPFVVLFLVIMLACLILKI